MDNSQFGHSVRQFITNHFPLARKRKLEDTDPLIESGVIDSLGVLDVVAFIEEEFQIKVEDEDLTADNFQNISKIASFVSKKRNG